MSTTRRSYTIQNISAAYGQNLSDLIEASHRILEISVSGSILIPLPLSQAPKKRKRNLTRNELDDIASTRSYKKNKSSFEQTECPICLETFDKDTVIRSLPCKHEFCAHCIERWTEQGKATCPVCKIDLK